MRKILLDSHGKTTNWENPLGKLDSFVVYCLELNIHYVIKYVTVYNISIIDSSMIILFLLYVRFVVLNFLFLIQVNNWSRFVYVSGLHF